MSPTQLKINTRDFGEITVPNDRIVHFPNGIYAFEELHSFVLLSPLGEEEYPMWLQSAEQPELCFIVFDPAKVTGEYAPLAGEEALRALDYSEGDELQYFVIAVIPEEYKKATVNLKSPVVINKARAKGVQIILEGDYMLRHPIFETKGDG